ncbi:MAG: M48 family metallopeptidase [Planctomycetia bacterium]|nr:M48 family metallopeptidase [Planctomycetia bacterium]
MNENPSENTLEDIMTPEQLAEVRAYNRIDLRCTLLDRAVDFVFLAFFTFWLAKPVTEWLAGTFPWLAGRDYAHVAALLVTATLFHAVISFPLSFYSGWMLEKRFHLSNLTAFHWFRRYLLQLALSLILNTALMLLLFSVVRTCGTWWWAVIAVVFFTLSVVLSTLMPTLLMRLFYHIEKLDDPGLSARFEELIRPTPLKLSGIYRLDLSVETQKANAMLAGLGRSRRVLLGDTLLQNFTEDEIIAVFAHEVGHQVRRHILKLMLCMFLGSFAVFWLTDFGLRLWVGMDAGGMDAGVIDSLGRLDFLDFLGYSALPVWVAPFFVFALSVISQILEPFQNALSRKFEREADAYAVENCGNPSAMRSAFVKLAIQNKADPAPPAWEVFWLHSHPAIAERIANIEAWKPRLEEISENSENF